MKKALGICIGASTISFVTVQTEGSAIKMVSCQSMPHNGDPGSKLKEYFAQHNCSDCLVAVTGRAARHLCNALSIAEPEAVEAAFKYLDLPGKYDAVASLGSENFLVYHLNQSGEIINVVTGSKCAAGTGEFFLQQIRRMDLDIDIAIALAKEASPYPVSGRCSVFCKSDCTHALNKGLSKGEVVAGLCRMIANKIIELLAKEKFNAALVIGGVCRNDTVIKYLKEKYPNLHLPDQATYFEALGASLIGLERGVPFSNESLFKIEGPRYSFLPALSQSSDRVCFKSIEPVMAHDGDTCILGLDVGSTTTKAVLLRLEDNAILASIYLRTNGAPVEAAVNCYRELKAKLKTDYKIVALGVTGSGRQIVGLHALTGGVINEIIAHAAAAAYFDKEVDTILEIGGQDAKYTFLTNGIASDYYMNEACSAGTGSFLEESARESLAIDYRAISAMALSGTNPPNFNDQCSAFIQSDLKTALQEGMAKADVVAGLVYSICQNYISRVKGNRPVGKKIFMQGGVCYNSAVPLAMSILLNKEIIVPPEPGLMGAFGVALELKKRIELGLVDKKMFDLDDLISREFTNTQKFTCPGGEEKCDRKCEIAVFQVAGQKFAFGGACSRYYNQRKKGAVKTAADYVKLRQELVFKKYVSLSAGGGRTIGIMKTFMTDTLYPLYYNFFTKLGFKVVLSDKIEKEGMDKIESAFCYPAEISHGFFQNLLNQRTDYIFLPHIVEMDDPLEKNYKRPCVFAQAEGYYLRSAFNDCQLPEIIAPVINFSQGEKEVKQIFVEMAKQLGKERPEAEAAYYFAWEQLSAMRQEFKAIGRAALAEIESDPGKRAMVIFGRPYNAFMEEANMGIPRKFASQGITVLPHDFLPCDGEEGYENMYWYVGQQIMKAARFIKRQKQLFGTYITNFSCGPDSLLISYFREIMGSKPSLTLELDSHTADIGIDTRIDAALDIINNYLALNKNKPDEGGNKYRAPLQVVKIKGQNMLVDDNGRKYSLPSDQVEVVIPSMGRFGSQMLAALFRSYGINSVACSVPTEKTLKYGKSATTGKECLPLILTVGSMLEYEKEHRDRKRKMIFFMPTGGGPCRQGQYAAKLKTIISAAGLKDIGLLSMTDESGYTDLGLGFLLKAWIGCLVSDLMQEAENAVITLAKDQEQGLKILNQEWEEYVAVYEKHSALRALCQLPKIAKGLSRIKLQQPLEKAKRIALVGEVFVRREEFSRVDLIKQLSEKGFLVVPAPVGEYFYYCNYLVYSGSRAIRIRPGDKIKMAMVDQIQQLIEKIVKAVMAKSGLVRKEMIRIRETMGAARHLMSEEMIGEGILTVGSALRGIMDEACGVVSIGPFACMPSRLAESILRKEMTLAGKIKSSNNRSAKKYPEGITTLPYLYIETDGNAFPQLIQSKIEIFMLQAERMNNKLSDLRLRHL